MRFVAIKTVDQADLQAVHRSRSLLIKTRTAFINQIRGLLGEYGLVIARSPEQVRPALVALLNDEQTGLPPFVRETFGELYGQLVELEQRIVRKITLHVAIGGVPNSAYIPENTALVSFCHSGHTSVSIQASTPSQSKSEFSGSRGIHALAEITTDLVEKKIIEVLEEVFAQGAKRY